MSSIAPLFIPIHISSPPHPRHFYYGAPARPQPARSPFSHSFIEHPSRTDSAFLLATRQRCRLVAFPSFLLSHWASLPPTHPTPKNLFLTAALDPTSVCFHIGPFLGASLLNSQSPIGWCGCPIIQRGVVGRSRVLLVAQGGRSCQGNSERKLLPQPFSTSFNLNKARKKLCVRFVE